MITSFTELITIASSVSTETKEGIIMINVSNKKQRGFTLIEIIIVILLLAIMTAFAVSRFARLDGKARQSTLDGLEAALHSAVLLSRAKYKLMDDNTVSEIDMDGTMVAVTSKGIPCASAAGIGSALFNSNGFVIGTDPLNSCNGNRTITFQPEKGGNSNCQLIYRENGTIQIRSTNC